MYKSKPTVKGNIGVSYVSQEAAEKQAAEMDKNNCINCSYCNDCINCLGCNHCYNCTNCSYCRYCDNCTNCINCSHCTNCYNCTNCTNCYNCRNCTDCTGILKWVGKRKVTKLLAINGLIWPVVTDGNFIQIGCQFHSVEKWEEFTDDSISMMHSKALDFWKQFKPTIMAMAKYKKGATNDI